jgi:hypothetical protein
MGRVLSGSGYQMCADYLVESGLAERRAEPRAPMGWVYRRANDNNARRHHDRASTHPRR